MRLAGPEEDAGKLFENAPAMLWQGDDQGRCVLLNRAQREFWGVEASGLANFDWSSTLLEEDWPLVAEPFGHGMTARVPFTCEARYRRADGEIRLLRTVANPLLDEAGAFLGMVGINEDVTDLREAEASLETANARLLESLEAAQASTRRFELATGISGLVMSEHDEALRYTWAHGLPRDSLGKTPSEIVGGELGALLDDVLREALARRDPLTREIEFVVEDRRQWWEIQACQTVTPSGGVGVLASALDVTARRLNQDKLEVLARELSHRVKNVYAVVQAVVHQAARASDVPAEFVAKLSQRLATLAAAQDALLESGREEIPVRELISQALGHVEGVNLQGPDAMAPARIAAYLALAIHELTTNSIKYGALGPGPGRVDLVWSLEGDADLLVEWRETGVKSPVDAPREGFGSRLLTKIFSGATGGTVSRRWESGVLMWSAKVSLRPQVHL